MNSLSMNLPNDTTWTWAVPTTSTEEQQTQHHRHGRRETNRNNNKLNSTLLNIPNNTGWTWALPTPDKKNENKDLNDRQRTNRHSTGGGGRARSSNFQNTNNARNHSTVHVAGVNHKFKGNHNVQSRKTNNRRYRGPPRKPNDYGEKNDVQRGHHASARTNLTIKSSKTSTTMPSPGKSSNNQKTKGDSTPGTSNNRHNQKKRKARGNIDLMDIDEEEIQLVSSKPATPLMTPTPGDNGKEGPKQQQQKQQQQQPQHAKKRRRKTNQPKNKRNTLSLEEKEYRKQMMSRNA